MMPIDFDFVMGHDGWGVVPALKRLVPEVFDVEQPTTSRSAVLVLQRSFSHHSRLSESNLGLANRSFGLAHETGFS